MWKGPLCVCVEVSTLSTRGVETGVSPSVDGKGIRSFKTRPQDRVITGRQSRSTETKEEEGKKVRVSKTRNLGREPHPHVNFYVEGTRTW